MQISSSLGQQLRDPERERPIDGFSLLMQCSGDVSFARAVLRRFAETSEALFTELERALSVGDLHATTVAACSLRGAALMLHAAPLVAAVAAVEAAAAGGIPTDLPLAGVRAAIDRCQQSIPSLLSDMDGGRLAIVA